MGETLNNILIGTANIADAAITPAKLSFDASQKLFATAGFTNGTNVQVDVTNATHTFDAGALAVGDVIRVVIAHTGDAANDVRGYLYLGGQLASTTQSSYCVLATGGLSVIYLHVLSTTKVQFHQSNYYNTSTNQVFSSNVISIADISANATVLKVQHKCANATPTTSTNAYHYPA